MDEIKEENRSELVDILDSYFDPEKEPIVPVTKKAPRRRSFKRSTGKENRRTRTTDKNLTKHRESNNNNDEMAPQTPDSTAPSPRRQRRFRKRSNNTRQLTPVKKSDEHDKSTNNNNNNNDVVGTTTDLPQSTVKTFESGYIAVA